VSIHDTFLELAATAIDFEIDPNERAELDRHLAGCDECRRTVERYREDAVAIAASGGPRLTPTRSEAILAAVLKPPRSRPSMRLLAVGALIAVLGAGLALAGIECLRRADDLAVVPSPGTSVSPGPSSEPTRGPSQSAGPTVAPGATPPPARPPVAGAFPVAGSGQELGTLIRMAPGTLGDLYVSVAGRDGTTLARVGGNGEVRDGWPILLPGATPCPLLLPASDGGLRVVCNDAALPDPPLNMPVRAFAFDPDGRPLGGWPVALPCCFNGRMVPDNLTLLAREYSSEERPDGDGWIVTVAPDGTVSHGARVPFADDCCLDRWAVGPGGVAYGSVTDFSGPDPVSHLHAVGFDGIQPGFPTRIDGIISAPAFDARAVIYVTVGSPTQPPAKVVLVDWSNGRTESTRELDLVATSDWNGAGGEYPARPIVEDLGKIFVVDTSDGIEIAGLDSGHQPLPGWPYRAGMGLEQTGFCSSQDTGCGQFRAEPVLGWDDVLYVPHAAATSSTGGRIVAAGPDGEIVDGWPVGLTRPGAEFWSIVVDLDHNAYALAIEPEPGGSHSATIVAIAPDSSVTYTLTVIEP
jgi:hypothetical protein